MDTFQQLKKNIKKDFSGFKEIKVALLGDSATQFLVQAIKGLSFKHSLNLNFFEGEFNQIERQTLDPTSELYEFEPEIVIVFQSSHKLLNKYNKTSIDDRSSIADKELEKLKDIKGNIDSSLNAKIIVFNYSEIDDKIYGNLSSQIESSFLFQLRKLNYGMMILAQQETNFHLCDLSTVQNQLGRNSLFQASVYVNTEMVLSIESLPLIADKLMSLISALDGKFKKCLILDLDNTTWGGVIGDDGVENIQIGSLGIGKAFTEFQYWAKKLKERGVILAICSKNTESVAKEPFENHPEMVLRLGDIAVFVANWENKADNIRKIQQVLNIGFDSMVFLDDNPFERNIVRENLPEVDVPELPNDPAEYLEYLYSLNLFETVSSSNEDVNRTKQYQVEAQRVKSQKKFVNENSFLESLDMVSKIESFNSFNTPRVAQLTQRSNQFNLRTIRYTDAEIKEISENNNYLTFAFYLKDKFGDNGLISIIILTKTDGSLFIDTWLMSCRVLKRGMEDFVINEIVKKAKRSGFTEIIGEYIKTQKNEMVKDHYSGLGFEKLKKKWVLNLTEYKSKQAFIISDYSK